MTDVQRIWLNAILEEEARKERSRQRLEELRARARARSVRR